MNNMSLTAVFVATSIAVLATVSAASAVGPFAQDRDVEVKEVYHPEDRPGYACWPVLWHDAEGDVYLAFTEKRRARNPLYEPIPLDYWESMGFPIRYHKCWGNGSRDVITELVVLKSTDDGKTWIETGRSPTKLWCAYSWASLPDGRIMRVLDDLGELVCVAFDRNYQPAVRAEVSPDGGKSWQQQGVIMKGYATYAYRLKRLTSGTLVQVIPYASAFGPGRERQTRGTKRPYVRSELTCGVFVSQDEGKTWSGPLTAFPGVVAWEPDFVELPSGDLLFLNSTVQGGPQVRQYFHKTEHGFVPGPVFDVISGRVPECVVLTRSGLLVGAVRGGEYTCSNDEGATWHKIEDLPNCHYQPYITELSDGRLLCAWHMPGGDSVFGELDQWVGSTTFRLAANLPRPMQLSLTRALNDTNTKYVNSYIATLTSGGQPVAGKTVHFAYHLRYTSDYDAVDDPRVAGTRSTAVTDESGHARLDLSFLDKETNMHLGYRVTAWFEPAEGDTTLAPCRSEVYGAYTMTMSQEELFH